MRWPAVLLSCSCLVSWAGCAGFLNPAAERAISVRGNIINVQRETKCSVRLFTEKGRKTGEIEVAAEFRRGFVVAPSDQRYYMEVSCPNQPGSFRSATFELGTGRKELDLGSIVLR
jgi:hypothetical protein